MDVFEQGKPSCSYEVIGAAFGASIDELRQAAAQHGGDGVYDTECLQAVQELLTLEYAKVQCNARVYVCGQTKAVRP